MNPLRWLPHTQGSARERAERAEAELAEVREELRRAEATIDRMDDLLAMHSEERAYREGIRAGRAMRGANGLAIAAAAVSAVA